MEHRDFFADAQAFWDRVYWAEPDHQRTGELVRLGWPVERLRDGYRKVISDRTRISNEIQPPSDYYTEIDVADWNGKHVLEFGCGMGVDALKVAQLGAIVTVTDIVESNVKVADRMLTGFPHGSRFLSSYDDLDSLGSFDVVLSHGVIHHLEPELAKIAMGKLLEHLNPDGSVYLMIYTTTYFPEPRIDFEGPYTRGFTEDSIAELLGPTMQVQSYRYVLGYTCAWVVARRRRWQG